MEAERRSPQTARRPAAAAPSPSLANLPSLIYYVPLSEMRLWERGRRAGCGSVWWAERARLSCAPVCSSRLRHVTLNICDIMMMISLPLRNT